MGLQDNFFVLFNAFSKKIYNIMRLVNESEAVLVTLLLIFLTFPSACLDDSSNSSLFVIKVGYQWSHFPPLFCKTSTANRGRWFGSILTILFWKKVMKIMAHYCTIEGIPTKSIYWSICVLQILFQSHLHFSMMCTYICIHTKTIMSQKAPFFANRTDIVYFTYG